jgi:hypothetical protein
MYKEIKPNNWILPNRIGYSEKIFKTFKPENYFLNLKNKLKCKCDDDKCEIDDNKLNLYPQQLLIKDYMYFNSPYRGILLYHELGAGKSGASIAAAEGYINKKKIFVLSPASLAVNYENEIKKLSSIGLNLKKDWNLVSVNKTNDEVQKILLNKYAIDISIIKKDGLIWIPMYENDIPNAKILKTKVDDSDKSLIDSIISHIIKNRYTFISYNGLTAKKIKELGQSPFDNSFVIIDEVHNYASRIVNGSKLAQDIYTKLMNATDCKIILLSGTPIINNPYEIATIINLIRGYMNVYELLLVKTSNIIDEVDLNKKLKTSNLLNIVDEITIDNENNKILISLLPNGYKRESENSLTIIKSDWTYNNKKAIDNIIKSLNSIPNIKIGSKYNTIYYSALPNKKEEFDKIFLDKSDEDNPKITNKDLFMRRILGSLSYYSISGSELFPNRNPDIIRNLKITDTQIKKYIEVRDIERKMESGKKSGVLDNKTSVYRAFSRMVCNFSFPENIERHYPMDIKYLVKKELDDAIEEKLSDTKDKAPKITDRYEKELKDAITKLIKGDYLSYDNVKKTLSPKFASMYDDINDSPGSVLVYSQFRSVEGLGLFSEFLIKNGFKQIDLKKNSGKYELVDTEIFDEKYDNKRFVIFDSDRDKTRILMSLFNNELKDVPLEISQYISNEKDELYKKGKLVKLFCITASGAEGISLKNVRRVLIMEPYWNNIRIDQVIGRAIRSCSHQLLPPEDRNVTVYKYIMEFTEEQIQKNYSINTVDKGITTDEHIAMMANKKMDLINQFLKFLKASSFDCIINSVQNKPLENGYKCYNWAIGVNNDDLSYTPNIKDDYKIMKHKKYQILKKNKGKVILDKDNEKYVIVDGKTYNYYSYKEAGILIPEQI